jgi:hypothetical protein
MDAEGGEPVGDSTMSESVVEKKRAAIDKSAAAATARSQGRIVKSPKHTNDKRCRHERPLVDRMEHLRPMDEGGFLISIKTMLPPNFDESQCV